MFCGKWFFLIQVGVFRNVPIPIPYIVVTNFAEAAFRRKPKNYTQYIFILNQVTLFSFRQTEMNL